MRRTPNPSSGIATVLAALAFILPAACNESSSPSASSAGTAEAEAPVGSPDASSRPSGTSVDPVVESARAMIDEGRKTFRFDTFGDEEFWGATLKLHTAIAGQANGGVGPGLSPKAALGLGLKVDVDSLPTEVRDAFAKKQVNLDDPKSTLTLLKANAVIGVTGFFHDQTLSSIGIQCAFCHSTVDDSFASGIGKRRDGWPNRDLDVGAIVALAPDLSAVTKLLGVDEATLKTVLKGWGPGKFDAEVFLDGKAVRPDGKTGATLMPAAFGLAGVNLHTYTGWGSVTYWNAFVANLEMHGKGTFFDSRLGDATRFPVAARAGMGNLKATDDRITKKLAALHFYQLALEPPKAPASGFDTAAAGRGKSLFEGKAKCASCHVPPLFTEPGWNMHTASEIGIDDFQAKRAPDQRYRTTPLRGLFTRYKGGFYHDGRFATLAAVVDHYDQHGSLGLSAAEKADLVEYLKSL